MTTTRIEFTQALRSAPPRSATRVRRQAVFACTVGAVLVAIALVVPVIAFLGHRVPADLWFGFALLTFGGILILTNAARNLRALSRLNFASRAVSGCPSWKRTRGRSLKRHVRSLGLLQPTASAGTIPCSRAVSAVM